MEQALIYGAPAGAGNWTHPVTGDIVKVLALCVGWDAREQVLVWLLTKGENPNDFERAGKTNIWYRRCQAVP